MTGQYSPKTKQGDKHMDPITIILLTVGAAALIGLAWMSGYDIGKSAGVTSERTLTNQRINGLLAEENARRPKAAKNRRKAARKGSSGGALS
jgi:hypothetical protein